MLGHRLQRPPRFPGPRQRWPRLPGGNSSVILSPSSIYLFFLLNTSPDGPTRTDRKIGPPTGSIGVDLPYSSGAPPRSDIYLRSAPSVFPAIIFSGVASWG